MSHSTRFTVCLRLLSEIAQARPELMTSTALAEKTGAHPVVIRRLLSRLAKAGLTQATPGKDGGARLALAPKRLSLRAVYEAVEDSALIARPPALSPENAAGACLLDPAIDRACRKAEKAFLKALDAMTLKDVLTKSAETAPDRAA
ncbi:MAG: Rrf2 family transcriptional regulator [Amphiplicatus sp.]